MTEFAAATPSFPAGQPEASLVDVQQRLAVLERIRELTPDAPVVTLAGLADWACTGITPLASDRLTEAAKQLAAAEGKAWDMREVQARYLGLAARTVTAYLRAG